MSVTSMRCDIVAECVEISPINEVDKITVRGIIQASKELDLKIPLIVRLQGTKVAEGKKSVLFIPLLHSNADCRSAG